MPFYIFQWTEEALAHIAEHGVSQDEFEEVVTSPTRVDKSRSTERPIAFGPTTTGKYLACVFESIDDVEVVPVTAYEV